MSPILLRSPLLSPMYFTHHDYFVRTTPPGPRMWAGFEDFINEDEQSPEFEVMAERWKDVVQMLKARRQEFSQSPANLN